MVRHRRRALEFPLERMLSQSYDPLDAYAEPPRVLALSGEVLISGPGAEAAYTAEAARTLARALERAADQAEKQRLRPQDATLL